MKNVLLSMRELACWFEVTQHTISDLVEAHEIVTKPIRNNGKARGLDLFDIQIIARALNRSEPSLEDVLDRFEAVA